MYLFAPLQGYTDCSYRRAHHLFAGGVAYYFTPFVRWEKGGLRHKDLYDVLPENNAGVPTIPQVIAKDREEFCRLCDVLQGLGWSHIDLNMGCPFPLQSHSGRGCGLLPRTDAVSEIFEEMERRGEVSFSVKMRLGLIEKHDAQHLLPLLNASAVRFVTLHPRTGSQQYKGVVDMDAFALFYDGCRKPLFYNGDLGDADAVKVVETRFPSLAGVMLGRGLLANPLLAAAVAGFDSVVAADAVPCGTPSSMGGHGVLPHTMTSSAMSDRRWLQVLMRLHERVFDEACQRLQGDHQILWRMKAFWEMPGIYLPRKVYKGIHKSTTLDKYRYAVAAVWHL